MPAIMPISDLRNYTDVLKEVDNSSRVYLTRNGREAEERADREIFESAVRQSDSYTLVASLPT